MILFTQYAFNAFTISQVSRELGLIEDWQECQNHARCWENLLNPDTILPDVACDQEDRGISGIKQVSLFSSLFSPGD